MTTTYQTTAVGRSVTTVLPIEHGRQIEIVTSLVGVPDMRTTATVWHVGGDGKARHAIRLHQHGDFNQVLFAKAPAWAVQQLLNGVQAGVFEQMPFVRDQVARHYAQMLPGAASEHEDVYWIVRDGAEVKVALVRGGDPALGDSS